MEKTMEELEKRHREETKELRKKCPHNVVAIQDRSGGGGYGREICIKCSLCGEPIVGWSTGYPQYGDSVGKVLYAKGFVPKQEPGD